jgi:hypothetical protein
MQKQALGNQVRNLKLLIFWVLTCKREPVAHWRGNRPRREAQSVTRALQAESHDPAGGKPAPIFSGCKVVAAIPSPP